MPMTVYPALFASTVFSLKCFKNQKQFGFDGYYEDKLLSVIPRLEVNVLCAASLERGTSTYTQDYQEPVFGSPYPRVNNC